MLNGAHSIIYSKRPEADRKFLRDVLGLPHVDVGDGWLVFGLPPSEVAVHPSKKNDLHEFYLMCEDVEEFVAAMRKRHIACEPVRNLGWGLLTQVSLPGGGKLGVYQPRHARPGEALAPHGAEEIPAPRPFSSASAPPAIHVARPPARTPAAKSAPKKTPAKKTTPKKTSTKKRTARKPSGSTKSPATKTAKRTSQKKARRR
jgi:hypothetical protein